MTQVSDMSGGNSSRSLLMVLPSLSLSSSRRLSSNSCRIAV
jgi:hypothetical protein